MAGRFTNLETRAAASLESEQGRGAAAQGLKGEPKRTAGDYLKRAEEARRRGEFEPALQLYTRTLGENRACVAAWAGQVCMLVELGEYPEARLWADKALELFKGNPELLAGKAQAQLREGDTQAASTACDLAIESAGASAYRWRVRGEILLATRSDRAKDCFQRSFLESGADWSDRSEAARSCLFHRTPALAMTFAQMGVEMRPDQPYAWLVMGMCQRVLGLADAAAVSLHRSFQLDPSMARTRQEIRSLESRGVLERIRDRMRRPLFT